MASDLPVEVRVCVLSLSSLVVGQVGDNLCRNNENSPLLGFNYEKEWQVHHSAVTVTMAFSNASHINASHSIFNDFSIEINFNSGIISWKSSLIY